MENYKLVLPEHLNQCGYLFGGYLLQWVDEAAWICASLEYPACRLVTVAMDRTEFLGRNGTLRTPEAMSRSRLSGRVGAALDPCAAFHIPFDLADGQEREFIFMLGAGRNVDEAGKLVRRFPVSSDYWRHRSTG